MTELAVSGSSLHKAFGQVRALRGLDLEVPRGRVVGFLGPNGAGKTTTLRILVGLSRVDQGDAVVLGADAGALPASVRHRIGYLPGDLQLEERLTVDEVLGHWARLRGGVAARRVADLCDRLGLDRTRRCRGLSAGNRRKVGLVGAFMGDPDLLVLDEPTSGIDPLIQAEFADLIRETRSDGRTVLLSSHVLSEVQHLADQVVLIREGRSVLAGSVDDLRHRARQPFTAWFRGEPPVEALAAIEGVEGVDVRGRQVSGVLLGSPDPLLAVLAAHPLEHLLLPEPDLEDVFLPYYEGER